VLAFVSLCVLFTVSASKYVLCCVVLVYNLFYCCLLFVSIFLKLSIEVVELDPCIFEIAKTWFEFKEDERMKIIIEDGLKYIETKGLHDSAFLRLKYSLHFNLFLYLRFVGQWPTEELKKDFIISRCVSSFGRLMRTNML